jgi:hypothetical protein
VQNLDGDACVDSFVQHKRTRVPESTGVTHAGVPRSCEVRCFVKWKQQSMCQLRALLTYW